MKNDRLFELLSNIDETFIEESEIINVVEKSKTRWHLPLKILAASLSILIISALVFTLLRKPSDTTFKNTPFTDGTIIIEGNTANQAPTYYGSPSFESDEADTNTLLAEEYSPFAAMTVRLVEALPDIYTFYEYPQTDFMLLKMETLEILQGNDLPNEFYYLIPEGCFTDFSIYDRFVIKNVIQYGYDYFVMYNTTKNRPESFDMILLGSYGLPHTTNGGADDIIAFDENGNFDPRLYESTEGFSGGSGWHNEANREHIKEENATLTETENRIRNYEWSGYTKNDFFARTYKDFSKESREVLEYVKNEKNGIFVPKLKNYSKSFFISDDGTYVYKEYSVQFRRYIDGFATNETITIYPDKVETTKASFDNADLTSLPHLYSAYSKICNEFEAGKITPPHLEGFEEMKNTVNGIFPWYAKTESGIVGIIQVSWFYLGVNDIYIDDKYYIIEPMSDICKPIENYTLVDMLGEYETTYIYKGNYDSQGKILDKTEFFTLR